MSENYLYDGFINEVKGALQRNGESSGSMGGAYSAIAVTGTYCDETYAGTVTAV